MTGIKYLNLQYLIPVLCLEHYKLKCTLDTLSLERSLDLIQG